MNQRNIWIRKRKLFAKKSETLVKIKIAKIGISFPLLNCLYSEL